MRKPRSLYWLSFRDPRLPDGHSFLGVSIVEATSFKQASVVAHELGCNPGGEVLGSALEADMRIPPEYQDRLLSRADVAALTEIVKAQ